MQYYDYYGIPLPKLDDGSVAIGAVVSIKYLDNQGKVCFQEFKAPDIHAIEALGMLTTFEDTIRQSLIANSRRAD